MKHYEVIERASHFEIYCIDYNKGLKFISYCKDKQEVVDFMQNNSGKDSQIDCIASLNILDMFGSKCEKKWIKKL